MTVDRALRIIAGLFVILSVLLGIYVNVNFQWFTLFAGANLFQCGLQQLVPDDDHPAQGGAARLTKPRSREASMPTRKRA